MSTRTRTALIGAASLAAAVAIAAAALLVFFPAERVGALAADRASQALERDVTVDRIRLRLWPVPAVALEGVVVGRWRHGQPAGGEDAERDAAAQDGGRPLATVERVEVRPKLLPLLRRDIVVHALVVERPRILVELEADPPAVLETAEDQAPGLLHDATFQVRRLVVRDGRVAVRDLRTGAVVRLDGIEQRMRLDGELRDGELVRLGLDGRLTVAALGADLPDALPAPVRDVRLTLEHLVTLDLAAQHAELERLAVRLQELELTGSGSVAAWADPAARRVSVALETGDADVAALVASLPAAFRSWPPGASGGEELRAAAGRVRVRVAADGRLGDGELPEVDGTVVLQDVALARGRDRVLTGLGGLISLSLDSLASAGLTGRLLDEPLRLAFSVHEPAAPVVRAEVSTALDLERATSLGLLPRGWTARGRVAADLTVAGPASEPAALRLEGVVRSEALAVDGPALPAPLRSTAASIALRDGELSGEGIAATIGDSDVTLDLVATGWLPFLLGDTLAAPRVAFDARSRFVDGDALFPADPDAPSYGELFFARLADRPVGGRSAAEAAREAGLRLPELPPVALDGRVRADRMVQRGIELRDVDVHLAGAAGRLEVRGASLRLFGGSVRLAGRLGAPVNGGGAPLGVEFQIEDVASAAFLQRFTAFRGHLGGSLRLGGAAALELDEDLLPITATVAGGGNVAVLDGQLVNWPLVHALGDALGIARFDTLDFRDWRGRFDVDGGRFLLQETLLEAGDLAVRAAGWFDAAGRIDLGATFYFGPGLTGRLGAGPAATLAAAAAAPDGRVPVGAAITGTAARPELRLDLSEAGQRLAERAVQEAEALARERARRLADELAERAGDVPLPAPDAPIPAPAEARERVEGAVLDRLRRALDPGRPAPAAPASDTAAAPAPPPGDDDDDDPDPARDGGTGGT